MFALAQAHSAQFRARVLVAWQAGGCASGHDCSIIPFNSGGPPSDV